MVQCLVLITFSLSFFYIKNTTICGKSQWSELYSLYYHHEYLQINTTCITSVSQLKPAFILEDRVCESPKQIGTHLILLLLSS